MCRIGRYWLLFGLVLLGVSARPAEAAIIGVTSAAALGGAGHLDWGAVPPGTTSNPFTMSTDDGNTASVLFSEPGGPFDFRGVFTSAGGPGEFAAGTKYIYGPGSESALLFGGPRTLIVGFDHAIQGIGFEVDATFASFASGHSNLIRMEAYSSTGALLGAHDIVPTAAENGLPRFVGVLSTAEDISSVHLRVYGYNAVIARYDRVHSFVAGGNIRSSLSSSAQVPEPASLLCLGGLLTMFYFGRRAIRPVGSARGR